MSNIYQQPKLQAVIDNTPKPRTFLTDLFFSNQEFVQEKKVAFDIVDGKRKLAPWVSPRKNGILVEDEAFQTNEYEAFLLNPYKTINPDDMLNRQAGEPISGSGVKSPEQREREQAVKKTLDLTDMVWNRIEQAVSQELFEGKLDIEGEGVSAQIKFWPQTGAPYKKLAGGALWNAATATIIDDLRFAKNEISKYGLTADVAIVGYDAAQALLADEKILKILDTSNYNIGSIDFKNLPQGVEYIGTLAGLKLHTYNESYFDEATQTEIPYVPPKKVLVGSTKTRTTLAFQLVNFIDEKKESTQWFLNPVTAYSRLKEGLGRKIEVKSRPLPIINQIRGFYVLEVL